MHFSDLSDRLHGISGGFTVWRCQGCGVLRVWPMPDDMSVFYPDDYYSYASDNRRRHRRWGQTRERVKGFALRSSWTAGFGGILPHTLTGPHVRRFCPAYVELATYSPSRSFRLLDVGCGSGEFLVQARMLGLCVHGIEASEAAAEAARASGIDCAAGGIEGLTNDAGVYDVIRLSHVLEHIADPVRALTLIADHLAPTGLCVIMCPNAGGAMAEYFGRDWFQLDPPRHLWGFTRPSLVTMLDRVGLRVLQSDTRSQPHLLYRTFRYEHVSRHEGVEWPENMPPACEDPCRHLADALSSAYQGDEIIVVSQRDDTSLDVGTR